MTKVLERLYGLGPPAVDRMVGLLKHEHSAVRERAAFGLREFKTIDERHLPELIRAYRAGEGWLPAAIARTGSDAALRFLQDELFRVETPEQVRYGLSLLGRRAEPFLINQLIRCRTACPIAHGEEVLDTLAELGPLSEPAAQAIEALAFLDTAPKRLRGSMEEALIDHRRPVGVDILLRRLGAEAGKADRDFDLFLVIRSLGDYGHAAGKAGPALLPFLARKDLSDARAQAALTLGQIGHRPAVPDLVALLAEADHDWMLGYNGVEGLARLGATDAKDRIANLARTHWFRPVRNNAVRALNLLSGGLFELPAEAGRVDEYGYLNNDLRYQDDHLAERHCGFGKARRAVPYSQYRLSKIAWPRKGVDLIVLEPPPAETAQMVRSRVPTRYPPRAKVTLLLPQLKQEWLIGINAGEWGGGLYRIDGQGRATLSIDDNVIGGINLDGTIYVFTGLAHLVSDDGRLWRMAPDGRMTGDSIRLPGRPYLFAATADRTLLIRTPKGDFALTKDGRLKAVDAVCSDEAAALESSDAS